MSEYRLIKEYENFLHHFERAKESLNSALGLAEIMLYDDDSIDKSIETRKKIENDLFYLDEINFLMTKIYEHSKEIDLNDEEIYLRDTFDELDYL